MLNIDYLNLMDKENFTLLKNANLDILKLHRSLYQKLLKLIRDLVNSKIKLWIKMRLVLIEP